jgi:hypothetical protein
MSHSINSFFKTQYISNGVSNPCGCFTRALPLSKNNSNSTNSTNSLNSSTVNYSVSCRMRYSRDIATYGTVKASTGSIKKTCSLGGPTFSY